MKWSDIKLSDMKIKRDETIEMLSVTLKGISKYLLIVQFYYKHLVLVSSTFVPVHFISCLCA